MRSVINRLDQPPVQTPVQIMTLPPYPKGKAVCWNLSILDSPPGELATMAAERDISPSQLVQELLWKALSAIQRAHVELDGTMNAKGAGRCR